MKSGLHRHFLIVGMLTALCSSGEKVEVQRSPAQATQPSCASDVTSYVSSLDKIMAGPNPWPSIPREQMRFIFSNAKSEVYGFGFSRQDFELAKIQVSRCPDFFTLYRINHPLSDFGGAPMAAFLPTGWSPLVESQISDAQKLALRNPLSEAAKLPVFFIRIPLDDADPDAGRPESAVEISTALHEAFHLFQAHYFVNFAGLQTRPSEKSLESCIRESGLMADFSANLIDLNSMLPKYDSLSMAEAKDLAKKITARRKSATTDSQRECWRKISILERIEGTALYFELENDRIAGLSDSSDPWWKKPLTADNSTFFYASGRGLARLLTVIDPSLKWQNAVQNGERLDEVLAHAIELP